MSELRRLLAQFGHRDRLDAIVLRPARGQAAVHVTEAQALADRGIDGDRSAASVPTVAAAANAR